jgi:3-deoxy-manno-octulosonate cytidylyltransferase (CMP-KDO synthetase)
MSKKSIGIIPSRYASTRFPGKPLTDIAGKSMIQRVYEQTSKSKLDKVVVATDDRRIYDAVIAFGGAVVMTGIHNNGTSRCIEAFHKQTDDHYAIMVNIQGDEPFIHPEQINATLKAFDIPNTQIATLAKRITSIEDVLNPNIVKVVFSKAILEGIHNALYFSRSPIPFARDSAQDQWLYHHSYYRHIGLYAFSRSFLTDQYPNLEKTNLEHIEMLEQLRWLENNFSIRILETTFETLNIDVPEDIEKALEWLILNS